MRKNKYFLLVSIMTIFLIICVVMGLRLYYHPMKSDVGADTSEEQIYVYQDELSDSEPIVESNDYAPNE